MRHRRYEIRLHTIDFLFRGDISYKNYRSYALLFRLKNVLVNAGRYRLSYPAMREPDLGGEDLLREISGIFYNGSQPGAKYGFAILADHISFPEIEHIRECWIDMSNDAIRIGDEKPVRHVVYDGGQIGEGILEFDYRIIYCLFISVKDLVKIRCHGFHRIG